MRTSGAFRPLPPQGSGQAFACQALELKATDGKGEQHGKMNERSWKWETYSDCLLVRRSAFERVGLSVTLERRLPGKGDDREGWLEGRGTELRP